MQRSGIILAGGRGERMGAFKPLVPWRGRPLLSYSIAALAPLCGEILVMAGPHGALVSKHAEGARVLADPGEGPHVALRLAARVARHGTLLVAPADSPFLRASTFAPLLAAGPDARFVSEGVANPLVGHYHRASLAAFRGRSLQELPAVRVEAGDVAADLRDFDTREELERA